MPRYLVLLLKGEGEGEKVVEYGVTEERKVIEARDSFLVKQCAPDAMRKYLEGKLDVKLFELSTNSSGDPIVYDNKKINQLIDEEAMASLSEGDVPEGGWDQFSDMDLL